MSKTYSLLYATNLARYGQSLCPLVGMIADWTLLGVARMSIEVRLVDPGTLPLRIAGIAVHAADVVTFLMRADLTAPQMANWITWLGRRFPDGGNSGGQRGSTPAPK